MAQVVDVYRISKPEVSIPSRTDACVYLETCVFTHYLSHGFSNTSIDHQIEVDFPRYEIFVDGHPCLTPRDIPHEVRIYCTQATMALPLTLLTSSTDQLYLDTIRDEPARKLFIDVWGGLVIVHKAFDVYTQTLQPTPLRLSICVTVNRDQNSTMFTYAFRPTRAW